MRAHLNTLNLVMAVVLTLFPDKKVNKKMMAISQGAGTDAPKLTSTDSAELPRKLVGDSCRSNQLLTSLLSSGLSFGPARYNCEMLHTGEESRNQGNTQRGCDRAGGW